MVYNIFYSYYEYSYIYMVSEISGPQFENVKAIAGFGKFLFNYASTENLYLVPLLKDQRRSSPIHHFTLGKGDGSLEYINSVEVDGKIRDPFWLNEYDNHLRVISEIDHDKLYKLSIVMDVI